jgi:microcystin-dependent protein
MSRINFQSKAFLGTQEMKRMQKFLGDDYAKEITKKLYRSYGFVVKDEIEFVDFKVSSGSSGKLTVNLGSILDSNGNIIYNDSVLTDHLTVPNDNKTYFVLAEYAERTFEDGTLNVDVNGNINGFGTKFTETLRGGPYHASKIKFTNSVSNLGEYEVLSVSSDAGMKLNIPSSLMTAETGIRYKVVGTFEPGTVPTEDQKYPFRRDYCDVTLSLVEPDSSTKGKTVFILASVINNSGTVTIVDRRNEFIASVNLRAINKDYTHPSIGIEKVIWDSSSSDLGGSLVSIGWGFKVPSASWGASANIITVNSGSGGILQTVGQVTSNMFDGWRVYFNGGGYTVIYNTVALGASLQLNVDNAAIAKAGDIIIVPNYDFIQVEMKSAIIVNEINNNIETFHISQAEAAIKAKYLTDDPEVVFSYRLLNVNGSYTTKNFIQNNSYNDEESFDQYGAFISSVLSSSVSGLIRLKKNPLNHSETKASLNSSNSFTGMQSWNYGNQLSNPNGLINLGNDGNNFNFQVVSPTVRGLIQKPVGTLVFISPLSNVVIDSVSLSSTELTDGYRSIEIPAGQSVAVTAGELVGLIYSGISWKLSVVPASKQLPVAAPPVGSVLDWYGNFASNFDATGLGISDGLIGWALCNGVNGTPDLRGLFTVMAINNVPSAGAPALAANVDPGIAGNTNFTMNTVGGTQRHTLNTSEMPSHSHTITDPGHNHKDGAFDRLLNATGTNTVSGVDNTPGEPNLTISGLIQDATTGITIGSAGGGSSHQNLPPYYVLARIMRIS